MLGKAMEASNFLKAIRHEGRLLILCHLVTGEKSLTVELEELLWPVRLRFRSICPACGSRASPAAPDTGRPARDPLGLNTLSLVKRHKKTPAPASRPDDVNVAHIAKQ